MNRGLGFIGFWFLVAWLVLLLRIVWQLRLCLRDRFEYISVALTPFKLNIFVWALGWALWMLVLGESWWFADATDTKIQLVVTVLVDGLCRPLMLAFLSVLWMLPLADYVPFFAFESTNEPQQGSPHTIPAPRLRVGIPIAEVDGRESTPPRVGGQDSSSDMEIAGRAAGRRKRGRVSFTDVDVATRSSGALASGAGAAGVASGSLDPPQTPTQASTPKGGASLRWFLETMSHAKEFITGETHRQIRGPSNMSGVNVNAPDPSGSNSNHAAGFDVQERTSPAAARGDSDAGLAMPPWEVSTRWSLSVQIRWILLCEVVVLGLFIAMTIWEAKSPLVLCSRLSSPETGACLLAVASPTHWIVIRPRVFTVITLFQHCVLFVLMCHAGRLHLERLGHTHSRRRFFRTWVGVLTCEAISVFCTWCRIFNRVRFDDGVVFLIFVDDIANQALLWQLVNHLSTAAPRPPLPESVQKFLKQAQEVALSYTPEFALRWWDAISGIVFRRRANARRGGSASSRNSRDGDGAFSDHSAYMDDATDRMEDGDGDLEDGGGQGGDAVLHHTLGSGTARSTFTGDTATAASDVSTGSRSGLGLGQTARTLTAMDLLLDTVPQGATAPPAETSDVLIDLLPDVSAAQPPQSAVSGLMMYANHALPQPPRSNTMNEIPFPFD